MSLLRLDTNGFDNSQPREAATNRANHRRAVIASALTVFLVGWLAGGCAKKPVVWTAQKADDLLHEIRRPVSSAIALSGSARISSQTAESLRKGRTYFALRAPNQLLLEAVTPSDETVAVLVTSGDRFMGFEIGDSRCRTGAPCAENVGQLFPISLDSIQIIRLLHGRPPLIAGALTEPKRLKDPARLRISITHENQTKQIIDFSPDGRDVLSTEIHQNDNIPLRIEYSDYLRINDNLRIPGEISVEDSTRDTKVRIQVTEVAPFSPKPETFGTQCPVGKLIMPMTCSPSAVLPR